MVSKYFKKGLLLGTITGLTTTSFEALFMFPLTVYIPAAYPALLLLFNVFFWIMFGSLAGCCLGLFISKNFGSPAKEGYYWIFFYIVPFALLYGFAGKIIPDPPFVSETFDHHLSFCWVFLILILLIAAKQRVMKYKQTAVSYFPEITVIIALYWFCSNIDRVVNRPRFTSLNFMQAFNQAPQNYLILIYIFCLLSTVGIYILTFFLPKLNPKKNAVAIAVLFLISCGLLGSNFLISQNSFKLLPAIPSQPTALQSTRASSNVILIVLDTLRADSLTASSSEGTKNLSSFFKDAVVYENCIAPSPWTLPSHASLFTGLYPTEHGTHKYLDGKNPWPILPDKFITLAEAFRSSNYLTSGVVSNRFVLGPWTNMNQGFQTYDTNNGIGDLYKTYAFKPLMPLICYLLNIKPKFTLYYRTAEDINRKLFYLINKIKASKFFVFVNYMDAHAPYRPPNPFSQYLFPQISMLKFYLEKKINAVSTDKEYKQLLRSQYDGETDYLIHHLDKLIAELKDINVYNDAMIIITSDHGEMFGEKNCYGHRDIPMYEGVLRIPLIIKYPQSHKTGFKKKMVSLTDLYPTILTLCNIPVPEEIIRKPIDNSSLPLVSEYYEDMFGEHRVIYEGNYKYLKFSKNRKPELYNLKNDLNEKTNLTSLLPDTALQLDQQLESWKKIYLPKEEKQEALSEELMEGLKTLGYIE